MDKLLLSITRAAAIAVLAVALFICACSLIYGLYLVAPSATSATTASPAPAAVGLGEMKTEEYSDPTAVSGSEARQQEAESETSQFSKDCAKLLPQLNSVGSQIGFRTKKEEVVIDASTGLRSAVTEAETDLVINANWCSQAEAKLQAGVSARETGSLLGESSLGWDVASFYISQLRAFLDAIKADSGRLVSMRPEDPRRYYLLPALRWFDQRFDARVKQSMAGAAERSRSLIAAKERGVLALQISGSAFAFFFLCSLILVFIRLEVNTRDIATNLAGATGKGPAVQEPIVPC